MIFFAVCSGAMDMFKKIKITLLYWIMNKIGSEIDLRKLEPAPTFFHKMKDALLKPFIDRNALNRIVLGPISFKIMQSAYNLGLFHFLMKSPGATLSDITTHLNIQTYPAEILLNGLEALNLVQKIENKHYYNTLSSMLLAQDFNDKFLSKLMNYVEHILTPAMSNLQESIVENKPMGLSKLFGNEAKDYYYELSKNQNYNQYFVPFMSTFSQINIQSVAESRVFSETRRLLDIGGSVGNLAMSIAKHRPSINVTVYDHPATAEAASQRFKEFKYDERLNAMSGDFLIDKFPAGYDGMLFSHVIDIFCEDTNKKLFQKAFDSLSTKGKIFIYTPIVHGDQDNSFTYKIYNAYFLCLANGQGQFYPPEKIVNWIKETGFSDVQLEYLPCNEILITGTKLSASRSFHEQEDSTTRTDIPVLTE